MNGVSINNTLATYKKGHALLVSSAIKLISSVEEILALSCISIVTATSEEQAFSLLKNKKIFCILIESGASDAPCDKFIRALRLIIGVRFIPIIILATTEDEEQLSYCMSAGCDDVLFKPFTALALNYRILSFKKTSELRQLYKASVKEQIVGEGILSNAMDERRLKFEEIELLNRSKAVFSGDLFLTARHPDGSLNIMLADFTGHGLPSAICSLPVAGVFNVMTEKGFELGYIIENINNKLRTLLPTGMFMACSIVNISNDLKHVKIWNGGMPDIYVRSHETGNIQYKLPSSSMPLGIAETMSNQYDLKNIELTPGDQLILFTDGLTESLNKDGYMFGEHCLEECLRKNNRDTSIFTALVNAFDEFRGSIAAMDDVTLACIPCTDKLMCENDTGSPRSMRIACSQDNRWHWYMELGGSSLREINPMQNIVDEIHKLSGRGVSTEKLSNIITLLYNNVIKQSNHGIRTGASDAPGVKKSCGNSRDVFIRIGIKKIYHSGIPALLVHMEDSGKQFTQDALLNALNDKESKTTKQYDEEYPLVFELNKLSRNKYFGNRLEAVVFENDNLMNPEFSNN